MTAKTKSSDGAEGRCTQATYSKFPVDETILQHNNATNAVEATAGTQESEYNPAVSYLQKQTLMEQVEIKFDFIKNQLWQWYSIFLFLYFCSKIEDSCCRTNTFDYCILVSLSF